jgi:hypothetical protein
VIQPAGSTTGGPVLWKNRDTDVLSNKVVFVDRAALQLPLPGQLRRAVGALTWAGLNSEGFAIINTVAYNLPERGGEMEDLEGVIMADALRTCRTVADFEAFLEANLGPELGSLANFGVIDGEGGAMLYEVHNHGFERIDPAEAAASCLLNTNFARTGAEGDRRRLPALRARRRALPPACPTGPVDFRNPHHLQPRHRPPVLLDQPTPFELAGVPGDRELWISTRDTINKAYTSAAVVLVGRRRAPPARWPPCGSFPASR